MEDMEEETDEECAGCTSMLAPPCSLVVAALKDYNVLLRALLHERSTLHGLHVVTRERTTQRTTKNHLKVKITSSASVSLAK